MEFFDLESVNPAKEHELLLVAKGLDRKQLEALIDLAKGLKK